MLSDKKTQGFRPGFCNQTSSFKAEREPESTCSRSKPGWIQPWRKYRSHLPGTGGCCRPSST